MKQLCVLGSTGSIGTQTLEVVDNTGAEFEVVSMTAGNNIDLFAKQVVKYAPKIVSVSTEEGATKLRDILENQNEQLEMPDIKYGMEGFVECSTHVDVDVVVAAMVGMIGLRPVIEAIKKKKDIALANKETLVTAGHIIMPLAKEYGVHLLPVDSEHSAIFQSLQSGHYHEIETIYLTASGGPFRHYTKDQLEAVTVEQALAHPNWAMGRKITTDSATMINKGLEVIEACWLFQVGIEQIHVLIQPKSVIHSMVEFQDGAVIAQLGTPDMKLPIQYALTYPKRMKLPGERLNFEAIRSLEFESPNREVLRGLDIARDAFRIGGSMTTVMNAANEYAVAQFLDKKIGFTDIYRMIDFAMEQHDVIANPSLDEILEVEQQTYDLLQNQW